MDNDDNNKNISNDDDKSSYRHSIKEGGWDILD
jgi:hypothetical protein